MCVCFELPHGVGLQRSQKPIGIAVGIREPKDYSLRGGSTARVAQDEIYVVERSLSNSAAAGRNHWMSVPSVFIRTR
jgi:hypothetical protein